VFITFFFSPLIVSRLKALFQGFQEFKGYRQPFLVRGKETEYHPAIVFERGLAGYRVPI